MWTIYADDNLILDTRLRGDEAKRYAAADIQIAQEVNKTGSLEFTVYPSHPNYDKIYKLRTVVTVRNDAGIYFRGRVLNDTLGFYNQRKIQCEGWLAVLLDSIQRPFNFPVGDGGATPADYLAFLLLRHNAQMPEDKQIKLGTVTVTDPNDYIARSDTQYSSTWQLINEGLLDTHGGYLNLRYEEDGVYLDYLSDFTTIAAQPVRLELNLLNLETERRGEEVATAILPLGAADEETEKRLTIETLPDEETEDVCKSGDLVYSKVAEAAYGGRIVQLAEFDDVTIVANLLAKAKQLLGTARTMPSTISITAADASAAALDNGVSYNTFRVGTYVSVVDDVHAESHGLASSYLIKNISLNPLNPAAATLTLGETTLSYTEANKKQQDAQWKEVQSNISQSKQQVIREMEERQNSAIQQSSDSIRAWVSDEYYLKGETDELISSVSTKIEQTADAIQIDFENLQKNLDDVADGADAQFSEIRKYIRFVDGNIVLGEEGNELILRIANDRISFLQSGAEVAYFSNQKLYVTDGTFLNSLQLGNFAFLPRSNGNLSFKKVTA